MDGVQVNASGGGDTEGPVGKYIWYCDKKLCWIPLKITSFQNGKVSGVHEGKHYESTVDSKTEYITSDALGMYVSDLTSLPSICEGSVIDLIGRRYVADDIYTKLGQIQIAVNPYKAISVDMAPYKKCQNDEEIELLAPHCFAAAIRAWNYCLESSKSQSIVVSGESGAGKTESTKLCLRLLSDLGGGSGIEKKLMQSSPILELFGNAKTVRNNNSSRFGKWMQMIIDNGKIVGVMIVNYLLEKSRVATVGKGERNYHAFYALLCSKWGQQFGLQPDPSKYRLCTMGGCTTVDGIDDQQFYKEAEEAFEGLHFESWQIEGIWRITAACLLFGEFDYSEQGEDNCNLDNDDDDEKVADFFKVDHAAFHTAVTNRKLVIMKKETVCPLSKDNAISQKNSFSRDIYNRMFCWMVSRMNETINKDPSAQTEGVGVGVLDIFGFEIFESNLFEQFCINWANEKLQQQFNDYTFNSVIGELKDDGIDTKGMSFEGNDKCIALIEEKLVGIVPLVVDECSVPKGSDLTLVAKMIQKHEKHKHFQKVKIGSKKAETSFMVKHFVEPVRYTFEGCLLANKDKTPLIFVDIMRGSGVRLVKELYGDVKGKKGKEAKTVAEQFKKQLSTLMKTMNATHPHYIRCVKPNTKKTPGVFDGHKSLTQLKALGVFEVIRVRSTMHSNSLMQDAFVKKFACIVGTESKSTAFKSKDVRSQIDDMLKYLNKKVKGYDSKSVVLGNTKVFWNDKGRVILNKLREKGRLASIIVIQSVLNSIYLRQNYQKLLTVRNGMRQSISNEDFKAIRHWKEACEQLGLQGFVDVYKMATVLLELKQTQEENNDSKFQQIRSANEDLLKDSPFVKQLKHTMPLAKALHQVEHDESLIGVLDSAIKQAEEFVPETKLLQEARVKYLEHFIS